MKRFVTVLFVLLVIGGSWYLYSRQMDQTASQNPLEGYKTAVVGRDTIEALVSATGSIVPDESQPLSFAAAGEVAEVLVDIGDVVVENQVLARLDDEDLLLGLKQAEASIRVSEAQLAKARKGAREEDIIAARAALESALAGLEDAQEGASWRDRELARLAVDQAKNSLWSAQGNRDAIAGSRMASSGQKDQAEAQVLNAEVAVKSAQLQYEKLYEPPKDSTIKSMEAQVAQAEAQLASLLAIPAREDVALVEAQVAQGQVAVESAQQRLTKVTLVAPFAGELSAWSLNVGDSVGPGSPIGTIVDTSRYYVEIRIDEIDIAQINVGQPVRLTADALPDHELTGEVTEIRLVGDQTQGIVAYLVVITLSPTNLPIRPMMTAAVDITVDRRENALVVPNAALRRDRQGKYVEAVKNGMVSKEYIETGVSNDTFTEIHSGLDEGQEIVISKPRENAFSGGPFGG